MSDFFGWRQGHGVFDHIWPHIQNGEPVHGRPCTVDYPLVFSPHANITYSPASITIIPSPRLYPAFRWFVAVACME